MADVIKSMLWGSALHKEQQFRTFLHSCTFRSSCLYNCFVIIVCGLDAWRRGLKPHATTTDARPAILPHDVFLSLAFCIFTSKLVLAAWSQRSRMFLLHHLSQWATVSYIASATLLKGSVALHFAHLPVERRYAGHIAEMLVEGVMLHVLDPVPFRHICLAWLWLWPIHVRFYEALRHVAGYYWINPVTRACQLGALSLLTSFLVELWRRVLFEKRTAAAAAAQQSGRPLGVDDEVTTSTAAKFSASEAGLRHRGTAGAGLKQCSTAFGSATAAAGQGLCHGMDLPLPAVAEDLLQLYDSLKPIGRPTNSSTATSGGSRSSAASGSFNTPSGQAKGVPMVEQRNLQDYLQTSALTRLLLDRRQQPYTPVLQRQALRIKIPWAEPHDVSPSLLRQLQQAFNARCDQWWCFDMYVTAGCLELHMDLVRHPSPPGAQRQDTGPHAAGTAQGGTEGARDEVPPSTHRVRRPRAQLQPPTAPDLVHAGTAAAAATPMAQPLQPWLVERMAAMMQAEAAGAAPVAMCGPAAMLVASEEPPGSSSAVVMPRSGMQSAVATTSTAAATLTASGLDTSSAPSTSQQSVHDSVLREVAMSECMHWLQLQWPQDARVSLQVGSTQCTAQWDPSSASWVMPSADEVTDVSSLSAQLPMSRARIACIEPNCIDRSHPAGSSAVGRTSVQLQVSLAGVQLVRRQFPATDSPGFSTEEQQGLMHVSRVRLADVGDPLDDVPSTASIASQACGCACGCMGSCACCHTAHTPGAPTSASCADPATGSPTMPVRGCISANASNQCACSCKWGVQEWELRARYRDTHLPLRWHRRNVRSGSGGGQQSDACPRTSITMGTAEDESAQVLLDVEVDVKGCAGTGLVVLELWQQDGKLLSHWRPLVMLPLAQDTSQVASELSKLSQPAASDEADGGDQGWAHEERVLMEDGLLLDLAAWFEFVQQRLAALHISQPHAEPLALELGTAAMTLQAACADVGYQQLLKQTGLRLLAHFMACGLPKVSSMVLQGLMGPACAELFVGDAARGGQGSEARATLFRCVAAEAEEAAAGSSSCRSLLHVAVSSGSVPMVMEVMDWAQSAGVELDWMARDVHGITPLDVALSLRDAGHMHTSLLHKLPPAHPALMHLASQPLVMGLTGLQRALQQHKLNGSGGSDQSQGHMNPAATRMRQPVEDSAYEMQAKGVLPAPAVVPDGEDALALACQAGKGQQQAPNKAVTIDSKGSQPFVQRLMKLRELQNTEDVQPVLSPPSSQADCQSGSQPRLHDSVKSLPKTKCLAQWSDAASWGRE